MKRWLIVLTLCAVCAAITAFFSFEYNEVHDDETDGKCYLIGMSQANLIEPWRVSMNLEFEQETQKHEELRVIYTDAAQDTQRQIQDVEMLMGYGIDLLVISPNDSEALRPLIAEVYRKIPVIVLDRAISGEDYTLFIGPNNDSIGYLVGLRVIDMLGEAGGCVVEMLGTEDSPPVAERSIGFARAISGHPNIVVDEPMVANWLQDQAEDRFKEYLIAHENFSGVVVAQSDAMAYGAYTAAKKLRVDGVRFVGVDGLDTVDGGIDLVNRGILDATFYCPTGGRQAVDYILKILDGEIPENKCLILDPVEIKKSEERN